MVYVEGSFKTYKVGASAIAANSAVKKVNGLIVIATAATDNILGVLQKAVAIGMPADVRLRSAAGTLQIRSGAAIAVDAPITSDANGAGITATVAGQQIIGYALEASTAAGQVIELLPSTAKF